MSLRGCVSGCFKVASEFVWQFIAPAIGISWPQRRAV